MFLNNKAAVYLYKYRFEFLLMALLLLIFDKIFFADNAFYLKYVWLCNMVVITIASYGIYTESSKKIKLARNIFSLIAIALPFAFMILGYSLLFLQILTRFLILYYCFIFIVVMRQITVVEEVRVNVIIGTFCGYMILSMIALFAYLFIHINYPGSFHGVNADNPMLAYSDLSYFSFVTLTSIGFGDIYPLTDMSRLTVAFFGMLGQFYMAAVVGIIVSRFTSRN
jgi:voltage-gated potassium channel